MINITKINELEKKIEILEGKLRMVTKQNWELKQSYDGALKDGLSKLNILKKSLDTERIKYLGLDKPETPKCLSSISYDDVLLNSIRNSESFRNVCNCFKEGSLKNMTISYEVKPKELKKQIEYLKGQGITYAEVETDNSNPEVREEVENDMKRKDKVQLHEVTGGYSYE